MNQAVAKRKKPAVIEPIGGPAAMLQTAIEKDLDVDKIERLMTLYERWLADERRSAYFKAIGKFQAEMPEVKRTQGIPDKNDKIKYRYATLDDILKVARPLLKKHKLTYRWKTETMDDGVNVTCVLTHEQGHEEPSDPVFIPTFSGQKTNAAQDAGSAIQYGRRYSFCNVTGIQPADDDDAESSGPYSSDFLIKHNQVVREWLSSILAAKDAMALDDPSNTPDRQALAEVIAEMPLPVMRTLSQAPTNGGMWTTRERNFMKTDKEFRDLVHQIRKESGWYDRKENSL